MWPGGGGRERHRSGARPIHRRWKAATHPTHALRASTLVEAASVDAAASTGSGIAAAQREVVGSSVAFSGKSAFCVSKVRKVPPACDALFAISACRWLQINHCMPSGPAFQCTHHTIDCVGGVGSACARPGAAPRALQSMYTPAGRSSGRECVPMCPIVVISDVLLTD